MSEVVVRPVGARAERRQFLHLPWELHGNDPYWIPPLRSNQKEMVGYVAHPFTEEAEIQTFLAFQGKHVVGRIAAIANHAHVTRHQDNRGFFGFFECVDDKQAAGALLDAALDWLVKRGFQRARGPTNPSSNYECGLLVDGFDSPPTIMMPYNPPYYGQLLEDYGFHKAQDLYSLQLPLTPSALEQTLNKKAVKIADAVIERFNVQMRRLRTTKFAEEIGKFFHVYNRSMEQTWGFVPISKKEIHHLSKSMKHLIVPELTTVAEVEGKPIGVAFVLPDYNPRIKVIDGRLFPFGFLRLLWNRQALKRARVLTANVLPEYQSWGVGVALLIRLIPFAQSWGLEEVEFSWVAESNHLSKGSLERAGAKITKTHRLYDYELATD